MSNDLLPHPRWQRAMQVPELWAMHKCFYVLLAHVARDRVHLTEK